MLIAESVFQVAVSSRQGSVDVEGRLSRDRFLTYFAQQPPAKMLLEACGSAHHWAREHQQPATPSLLSPAHDVHRHVRRNKTDRADAKALPEADRNRDIYAVPVKTVEAQAIASLHRLRSAWLATRTARLKSDAPRAECKSRFRPVIPSDHVVPRVMELLVGSTPVPDLLRAELGDACDEIADAAPWAK